MKSNKEIVLEQWPDAVVYSYVWGRRVWHRIYAGNFASGKGISEDLAWQSAADLILKNKQNEQER